MVDVTGSVGEGRDDASHMYAGLDVRLSWSKENVDVVHSIWPEAKQRCPGVVLEPALP